MNTREQFGKFLLLKKLTEDPLGETFRARILGEAGMEKVLLRVFNGQGLDGHRLWESVKDRRGIQSVLRSPNIGEGVEMGQIQGIPYVAYDYVSGKNMAVLLEQAAKKRNYVPTEHALLITERVALALAAASETRIEGQRIHHGFLVPQLTMISNEGETRLLGFEVGPGLLGFAANPVIRQHFGRYLSPETLAGAEPEKSDDVYSLGVLLFELLTGRPLPAPGSEGYGPIVDQGTLATEQEPIPEELRELLKKSLVAREQRLDDVVAWHKTLNSWMFEGRYNPTTFNLAFFMHNLFRQEIERESQEIEVEKTLPIPIQRPESSTTISGEDTAAAAAAAPPVQYSGDPAEQTGSAVVVSEPAKSSSKTGLFVGVAVVLAAVAAAVVFFMMGRGDSGSESTAAPPPPSVVAEPPPGPTPEELAAQAEAEKEALDARIKELVEKQTQELEAEIRQGFESEIDTLKRQRDEMLKEAERRRAEAERERQRKAAEQLAAQQAEEERKKAEEAEAAAKPEAEEAQAQAQSEVAQAEPPPPPPKVAPPPPPPPPEKPQVRRGDLVEIGPDVSTPEALRLSPRFPEMARRLRKSGATVTVKALIDENGKVLEAEILGQKVGYGFDNEALQAVKKATFKPAAVGGVPVKVWFNVKVEFQR